MNGMKVFDAYRLIVLPDHATPIALRTHSDEPVPFVIFDSREQRMNDISGYDETITGLDDILMFEQGFNLMDYFIKGGRG